MQLNHTNEKFDRFAGGRCINFPSGLLAGENGASREQAIKAWKQLNESDIPKDYKSRMTHKSNQTKMS